MYGMFTENKFFVAIFLNRIYNWLQSLLVFLHIVSNRKLSKISVKFFSLISTAKLFLNFEKQQRYFQNIKHESAVHFTFWIGAVHTGLSKRKRKFRNFIKMLFQFDLLSSYGRHKPQRNLTWHLPTSSTLLRSRT